MMVYFDGIIESLQKNGGVSVVFKELINNLSDSLLFEYSIFGLESSRLAPRNVLTLPYRSFERYRKCPVMNNAAKVFHSTYYRLPDKKVPIITTVHDFTYEYYSGGFKRSVHCYQKYNAIKNSDIVICVSNNTALDLMRFCPIKEDKVRVIHNGVSDSYYVQSEKKVTNDVLFVGSRAVYKNFDIAVKAVSMNRSICLNIIGGGELSRVELDLLNHYIPFRYKKYGFISDFELNNLYNKSLALIYPSSYEGFGIPLLEAMKAGCPIICGNTSSIPEVVGEAGLVLDDLNEFLVSDAIKYLQNNSVFRSALVSGGLDRAEQFSWKQTALQTNQIYQLFT
ncbi:glycosyltransferase family 4 protein [Shewanella algae]|uniref:glycosyltransferase family 4 protein n=1 Tax=Shewanella algae TaxID=38313 RepID=UPI001AAEBAF1|nr:glycosyltransferase family 1 protein [Shewanella algae]MBO2550345.1 glycosyltransferase family 4 protein [Shewanella algae]